MSNNLSGSPTSVRRTNGFRRSGRLLRRDNSQTGPVRRSLRARTCLAMLLLAIVLALTGCDDFFDVLVENHTDQELTVQLTVSVGEAERRVRPCSVYLTGPFASRPGERVEVRVLDRGGNSLYSARVLPEGEGKAFPQIYARIPSEGSGDCPLPVSGSYIVKVKNCRKKEAFVFLDDAELGLVEASSTQTFGPFPGAWEAALRIDVRDSEGKSMVRDFKVDYDLGQVPEVLVSIAPW